MPRQTKHRPANMMITVVLGPMIETFKATHKEPRGGWDAFNLPALSRACAEPALLELKEWAEELRMALVRNIDFTLTFCTFVREELWKMSGTPRRAKLGAVLLFMCSNFYEELRSKPGSDPDASDVIEKMRLMKWNVPSKATVKNARQEFARRVRAARFG